MVGVEGKPRENLNCTMLQISKPVCDFDWYHQSIDHPALPGERLIDAARSSLGNHSDIWAPQDLFGDPESKWNS